MNNKSPWFDMSQLSLQAQAEPQLFPMQRPQNQMDQQLLSQLAGIPNKGPQVVQKGRIPQSNEVISMDEEVVSQSPQVQPEPDYEAEMNKLYLDQIKKSQANEVKSRQELNNLGDAPSGIFATDLTPLANMFGVQGYNAPTMRQEYDKKRQLLQAAAEKGQSKATEDQLNYLKLAADKKKNEELARLREISFNQRGEKSDSDYEMKLRKEYMSHPMYKSMGELDSAYQAIESNPGVGGPAQQALVYQFSKILDPGSVVRETEYAISAANAGKIAQARNYFTMMQSGQMLTPEQVGLMKEVTRGLIMSARGSLNKHNETYKTLAGRKGIDPTLIVTDNFTQSVPTSAPKVDPARARLEELRKKAGKQ